MLCNGNRGNNDDSSTNDHSIDNYRAIKDKKNSDDSDNDSITTNTNDNQTNNQTLTSLSKPSISVKSWFRVCSRSSLELMPPRTLARASSSSMKMMLGCDATPL